MILIRLSFAILGFIFIALAFVFALIFGSKILNFDIFFDLSSFIILINFVFLLCAIFLSFFAVYRPNKKTLLMASVSAFAPFVLFLILLITPAPTKYALQNIENSTNTIFKFLDLIKEITKENKNNASEHTESSDHTKLYNVDEIINSNLKKGEIVRGVGRITNGEPPFSSGKCEGGEYRYILSDGFSGISLQSENDLFKANKKDSNVIIEGKLERYNFPNSQVEKDPFCGLSNVRLINLPVNTYTVDELFDSNLPENTLVNVKGVAGNCIKLKIIDGYEGSGSGCFIEDNGGKGSLNVRGFETLAYKDREIILNGFVGYCGGKKVPKFICALEQARIIENNEK